MLVMTRPRGRVRSQAMDLEEFARNIAGRDFVVVGSGPLETEYVEVDPDVESIVAVNGGIASVHPNIMPAVWVLNSRTRPNIGWSRERKELNQLMLQTGAGRAVGVIVFLNRQVGAEVATDALLEQQGTIAAGHVVVKKMRRRMIEQACGLRVEVAAGKRRTGVLAYDACSAGVFTAAMLCWAGARRVRLAGISMENRYHYLPGRTLPAGARGHLPGDMKALPVLAARFPGVLVNPTIPNPTGRRWWRE